MSGIYIPNAEAPQACSSCRLRMLHICRADSGAYEIPSEGKRQDCPVIPISGKIIDADPIIKFITDGLNSGEFGYDQIRVLTEIQYAPTMIRSNGDID